MRPYVTRNVGLRFGLTLGDLALYWALHLGRWSIFIETRRMREEAEKGAT